MNYNNPNNSTTLMQDWVESIAKKFDLSDQFKIQPLLGDASTRKYYLLQDHNIYANSNRQFIIMQSKINTSMFNFVKIANFLSSLNLSLQIPKVLASKNIPPDGFMILSYLGEDLLFNHLKPNNAENLYHICLKRITAIQNHKYVNKIALPKMDRNYIKINLMLFKTWYLQRHLNLPALPNINNLLLKLEDYFVKIFTSQPQVFVHLDYHSKNIILESDNLFALEQNLGILDFQDAMIGPLTYDMVSLLQDAYIVFPTNIIEKIVFHHHDYLAGNQKNFYLNKYELLEYFYLTGLQRHIKNLGIFSRLKYHYNKPNYINYIPNLLKYIYQTCELFGDQSIIMLKNLLNNYQQKILL